LLPPRSRTLWTSKEPTPSRNEVLARYRHLREISKQHHFAIMKLFSRDAMATCARWWRRRDGWA
jgi:hypothetical protein